MLDINSQKNTVALILVFCYRYLNWFISFGNNTLNLYGKGKPFKMLLIVMVSTHFISYLSFQNIGRVLTAFFWFSFIYISTTYFNWSFHPTPTTINTILVKRVILPCKWSNWWFSLDIYIYVNIKSVFGWRNVLI
jgi:hypothetical protein